MAYRKIDTRMWDDDLFVGLSSPTTKLLFCYVLTGPQTTPLPGLFISGLGSLADGFRMDAETVSESLGELIAQGRVQVDRTLRVIRVPRAPKHNRPENPNVVKGWWTLWKAVPESPLKYDHLESLEDALPVNTKGAEKIREAWDATFGTVDRTVRGTVTQTVRSTPAEPVRIHKHLQEHEHDQEQEHDIGAPPSPAPPVSVPPPTEIPPSPMPPAAPKGPWKGMLQAQHSKEGQNVLRELWSTYRETFDKGGLGGTEYHFMTHGDLIAKALREPPLRDQEDPVAALYEAFKGYATDGFRMGEGRYQKRSLHVLLRAENLAGAIDRARAQASGLNPDALPPRREERSSPVPSRLPPREEYREPVYTEEERSDPEARRSAREIFNRALSHRPDGDAE